MEIDIRTGNTIRFLVNGCAREKIAAFTGDGTDPHVMEAAD